MNRNPKKERGAVAIETALTLPVFMLAILALMLGSMLFRAQSMMQYALNQTAKEISGYFYLIDKLGLATVLSGSATDATNAQIQNVNNTIYDVLAFSGDIKDTTGQIVEDGEAVQDSVQESIFAVEDLVNNPMDLEENAENLSASVDTIVENTENLSDDAKEALELYKADFQKIKNDLKVIKGADKKTMIVSTLQIFGKAFLNRAFAEVATPIICNAMMPKYLTDGDESAFFEAAGIIEDSIDFTGSRMLHDGKTISLIVQYKIDASKLTLGFYKKELTFQHVAVTSAWLRNYDTGSLKTLKEINDTFDPDKLAEHADELNALYAELEAERLANEKEKQDKIDELNIQKADITESEEADGEETAVEKGGIIPKEPDAEETTATTTTKTTAKTTETSKVTTDTDIEANKKAQKQYENNTHTIIEKYYDQNEGKLSDEQKQKLVSDLKALYDKTDKSARGDILIPENAKDIDYIKYYSDTKTYVIEYKWQEIDTVPATRRMEVLSAGKQFDRVGLPSGRCTGAVNDDGSCATFKERSIPYHITEDDITKEPSYHRYEALQNFTKENLSKAIDNSDYSDADKEIMHKKMDKYYADMKKKGCGDGDGLGTGKIAPMFEETTGATGGGKQYDMPLNMTELEKIGMIKEVPKDQY